MSLPFLTAFRLLSLFVGLGFLLKSFLIADSHSFLKAIVQLLGSVGVVQAIALGSWKMRRLLIQSGFPRLLSPPLLVLHLGLRSSVLCGMFLSFLISFKLNLTTPSENHQNFSSPLEGLFLALGLGLLTLWIYWWKTQIQNSISRQFGIDFWRSISLAILVFTRVLFASVGVICTFLVIMADWLNLDPTPGWGLTRKIQFTAGITLLAAGYLLYNRSIHLWLRRKLGRDSLRRIRSIVSWFTRSVLLISGAATMILVGGADWLGLDPTPGWGWPRRFQFLAGLLLVLAGIFLQNQLFHRWSYKMNGLKVLSSTQITLLIVLRLLVVASGILVTGLVFTADFFHLDPTPGWSESRFLQLAAGIALIASGFVSHHTSLLRWQLRRLFD